MDEWLHHLVFNGYSWLVVFILFGIFATKSVIWIMPQSAVYVLSGALLPLYIAYPLALISVCVQLFIGYYIGNKWGSSRVDKLIQKNERARKFFEKQNKAGAIPCLLVRLTPAPLGLMNLYFGASSVKFKPYLVLSLIGMLPYLIIYIFVGFTFMSIIV